MDEEQREEIDEAIHGPDLLLEEVAGPQRSGVPLDELGPGAFAPCGLDVEAVVAKDIATSGLPAF